MPQNVVSSNIVFNTAALLSVLGDNFTFALDWLFLWWLDFRDSLEYLTFLVFIGLSIALNHLLFKLSLPLILLRLFILLNMAWWLLFVLSIADFDKNFYLLSLGLSFVLVSILTKWTRFGITGGLTIVSRVFYFDLDKLLGKGNGSRNSKTFILNWRWNSCTPYNRAIHRAGSALFRSNWKATSSRRAFWLLRTVAISSVFKNILVLGRQMLATASNLEAIKWI